MTREEVNRDIKEIAEVLQSDADAKTKYKMISNILSAKPHYFEVEQDLCKNCLFGEGTVYCREHCPYEAKTEQKPCDTISREDINSIAKEVYLEVANMTFDDDLKYKGDIIGYVSATFRRILCEKVSNLPPVESSHKGKWEYTKHYGKRYRVCPFCKAEKEDDLSSGWNFCQYCGADMRGAE